MKLVRVYTANSLIQSETRHLGGTCAMTPSGLTSVDVTLHSLGRCLQQSLGGLCFSNMHVGESCIIFRFKINHYKKYKMENFSLCKIFTAILLQIVTAVFVAWLEP